MWERSGRGTSGYVALDFEVCAGEGDLEDLRPHAGCDAPVNAGYYAGGAKIEGEEVGARSLADGCGGVGFGSDKTDGALNGCIHLKQEIVPGKLPSSISRRLGSLGAQWDRNGELK